ncbi:MAG TPA: hypothetical protein VE868_03795 [Balneolaceae bacterium]|nr:hypothetical protein [Balneolaceae bacterium]
MEKLNKKVFFGFIICLIALGGLVAFKSSNSSAKAGYFLSKADSTTGTPAQTANEAAGAEAGAEIGSALGGPAGGILGAGVGAL